MGKHGKLVTIVSSDEEAQLIKGPERPIIPAEHRVNALSRLMHVDMVAAIPGNVIDPTDFDTSYRRMMMHLSPHIRIVGNQEDNFEPIRKQCESSGVLLLHSNSKRITGTTEIIQTILDRHTANQ